MVSPLSLLSIVKLWMYSLSSSSDMLLPQTISGTGRGNSWTVGTAMLLYHMIQSIACFFKNSLALATGGDIRVLKWNFSRCKFMGTLRSSPKSISFWHVVNIVHCMVSGIDDLYFLFVCCQATLGEYLKAKKIEAS